MKKKNSKSKKKQVLLSRYTPKKMNFARLQKGRVPLIDYRKGSTRNLYNACALVALKPTRLNQKYMERARLRIARGFKKKKDKVWVRINTSIPVGKKPIDQKLGRGKAKVNTLVARVPAGRILIETSSKSKNKAIVMLLSISKMLGIPSYIKVLKKSK